MKENKNSKKSFNNPIDQEEYNHFETTKRWLQNGIDSSSKKSAKASDSRKQYNGNDKNDIPPILEANGARDVSQEDIAIYREALQEPYFARLAYREIYSDNTLEEDIYIGKNMIQDDTGYGSEILIHSWTSDIANELLYSKRTKPYEKLLQKRKDRPFDDDEKYILHPDLRRMILSEKGQYVKHINEYVSEAYVKQYDYGAWLEAGEQIADQFLLEILEQKKDESQITNIIRTIQENQNTVIRLPLDKNFIVEGCAGSGKTMIMLHRLSYLGERESQISEMNVQVLTPSEDFNAQMSALSKDLNLGKINISSVGQYYRTLLKKIDWLENSRAKLRDDMELPTAFLQQMYSENILNMMYQVSIELTNKALKTENYIQPQEIERYVKQLNLEDKVKFMNYNKIDELIAILDALIMRQDAILKEKKDYENDRDKFAQRIYVLENKITLEEDIARAIDEVKKYLSELQDKINRQYDKAKMKLDKDLYRSLQETIEVLLNEVNLDDEAYVKRIKECAQKANKDKPDKTLEKAINVYDSAINVYKNSEMLIENNKSYIVDLTMKIINIENVKLSEEIKIKVERYLKELKRNKSSLGDYKQTFEYHIRPYIEEQCKKYKLKFNQNYKYYSYLKLWWYYQNGGTLFGKYMICIDEAQNVSITEYKLLNALHGAQTIFNIYGDLLQNTRQELGLTKWSTLQTDLFDKKVKVYTFAENYRNTNQITDYVNENLDLSTPMKKIGYDGLPVKRYPASLRYLFQLANSSTNKTAIIFSELTKDIVVYAEQYGFSIGKVDNEGVSVLTIDEVKGLEFHTVYVVDNELSYNEKYIAYTRALKQLYIVELD